MRTKDELTIPEAAARTGLSKTQIRNLLASGSIRHARLAHGQIPLISQSTLDGWVRREFGSHGQLDAALRADRRAEAGERSRAVAKARTEAHKLSKELTEKALERAQEALRRVSLNDYSRRLAQARANGVEAQFRRSERAKFEQKKAGRERAALRARMSRRGVQPISLDELKRQSRRAVDQQRARAGLPPKPRPAPARSKGHALLSPPRVAALLSPPRVAVVRDAHPAPSQGLSPRAAAVRDAVRRGEVGRLRVSKR